MPAVAVIYDHLTRPETTGSYCLRALAEIARVDQYHPSQLSTIRRDAYDLYLFVDDGLEYSLPSDLRPQAYWAIDTHIDIRRAFERASRADFVFAAQKNGAEQLAKHRGDAVPWLPLACDPIIHARQQAPTAFNICFVGNLVGQERQRLVQLLQSEFIGAYVGRHYFEEMAAVYSASRLVFNRSVSDDVNMRVFEALCSGSLLITNALSENGLDELFQDARHLITYQDDEELVDKVRFYLKNDSVRTQIAASGRDEALTKHTYRMRMERILDPAGRPAQTRVLQPVQSKESSRDPHYFDCSRPEILALIPTSAELVLDVGCGSGQLGRSLKEHQECTVYGVEKDLAAAQRAQEFLNRVWIGDVEIIALDLPAESLDVIICGDVLEHLLKPQEVLRRLGQLLKRNGRLIASIPNVAHHTVIRSLLAGNWTYQPAGLLDETHLQFFTAAEIEKLFFRAGYQIEHMEVVRGPGDDSRQLTTNEGDVHLGRVTIQNLSPSVVDNLTAYQFLVAATPSDRRRDKDLTSIVLVTHNQLDYTKLCLASIRSRTDEPFEIIVVDNGSSDGTLEYLRADGGVRLLVNHKNKGFPAAANAGIQAAQGEYILLLNNDCVVTTGWLWRMLCAVRSAPDIGLVGPCSNCVSGEQQIPVDYELLENLDGFAWERAKRYAGQYLTTDRLVGFCLLFKRSVVDRIGLLDERFGIGNFEDDDFCRRAKAAGFKALIAQDSFVHHFGGVTFRANRIDFGSLMDRNRRLFEDKWRSTTPPVVAPSLSTPRFDLAACDAPGLRLRRASTKLSLCMIVRDSSRTLGACLESVRPWVDEIIVVDTGSTDETPKIAESHGAKVFYFPWCDNFSAARNESLSHATGDWLFWMDSDDTIDPENGRKLRDLVNGRHSPEVVAYVAQVHCPHDESGRDYTAVDHVKLFRNLPEIRFEGRIHEQVLPAINRRGGQVEWTDIFVDHSGSDNSREGQAKKLDRDLKLLLMEDAERPGHPFTLFNLGMTYLEMKRFEDAAQCLECSIAVARANESHVPKAFSLLIQSLSEIGRMAEAYKRCDEGVQRYPDDPELAFRAGVIAAHCGRPQDAERFYLQILQGPVERKFRSVDRGILGYKTRQNLACLYDEQNQPTKAQEQWRLILAERPGHHAAWQGLLTSLLKQNKASEARDLICRSKSLRQSPALLHELEARVEEAVGNVQAARRILESALVDAPDNFDLHDALCRLLFEHDELEIAEVALKTLVEKFPDNASALYNLATVHLRQRRFEAAAEAYEASLAVRPNWPTGYVHLATCYRKLGRSKEADAVRARARSIFQNGAQAKESSQSTQAATPWFQSADDLAAAVDACIQSAEREESKLPDAVMSVSGMTSRRMRHLLNRLGELAGCRFLEIGTGRGATVLAASFNNSGSFLSVDNFSEYNDPDPRTELYANLKKFRGHCRVDFRELDCWTLPVQLPQSSINVYFYDGAHTREAQRDALLRYADVLTNPFVLLIDDWNFEWVAEATQDALEELGWSLHRKWVRRTYFNGDADSWWNGLLVAVVTKNSRAIATSPAPVAVKGQSHEGGGLAPRRQCSIAAEPTVCLIACYFGAPPGWIKQYLLSCAFNPSIDFLLFTDQMDFPVVPSNVKLQQLSLASFNALAARKTALDIRLSHARKVCEFKPLYGHLFDEFLGGYDYWGYSDLDVIYGDIRRFLRNAKLEEYELFTARAEYLVGHFTLWRNNGFINTLYQQSADYQSTLQTLDVLGFDECGHQWQRYLHGGPPSDDALCDSMTHVVHRLMADKKITACFYPAVIEWPEIGAANWRVRWRDGRLWSVDQRREFMYFHFHAFKNRPGYRDPCLEETDLAFEMSPDGFERSSAAMETAPLSL